MICFLSKQFSSKGKSLNPSGEIWKSTRLYWRDLVTVCRQKKAEKRHFLSDWPKRGLASFLNTVQLHPLWVKLYQLDREDQALLVGLPVGEGDALWAELCEGPLGSGVNQVHAENPKSLSGLEIWSILLDQWEEGANLPRAPPSIILNIIHSLHTDCDCGEGL